MNKYKKVFFSIAIISSCIISVKIAYNYTSTNNIPSLKIPMSGQATPRLEYVLEADTNSLPSEAMVYKFVVPDKDKKLKELGSKLKFTEDFKLDKSGEKYINRNDRGTFWYEQSTGHWALQNLDALSDISRNKDIPDDNKAIQIAKKYLKDYDILPKRFNKTMVVPQYTGDDTTNDKATIYKDVYCYPQVNGVDVLGVSRVIVSIGDKGQVIAVNSYYKDVEEYRPFKLKSISKSFDEVKNNESSTNINPKSKKAKVKKVSLGYFEDAGSLDDQPYLQPVWIFQGESTLDSGEVTTFDSIVPAIE